MSDLVDTCLSDLRWLSCGGLGGRARFLAELFREELICQLTGWKNSVHNLRSTSLGLQFSVAGLVRADLGPGRPYQLELRNIVRVAVVSGLNS